MSEPDAEDLFCIQTDYGRVGPRDGSAIAAKPADLWAYETYVSRRLERSYRAGAPVRSFSDFLGYADWDADGRPDR